MTNWQLIIGLATIVFAIFGAGWLNLHMLKSYIDAWFDEMKAELEHRSSIRFRAGKPNVCNN